MQEALLSTIALINTVANHAVKETLSSPFPGQRLFSLCLRPL